MERQERITLARQECMQNLSFRGHQRNSEQEKQEMEFPKNEQGIKGRFGIRCIVAVLFFLFLFGMKQEKYSVGGLTCESIVSKIQENSLATRIETTMEQVVVK